MPEKGKFPSTASEPQGTGGCTGSTMHSGRRPITNIVSTHGKLAAKFGRYIQADDQDKNNFRHLLPRCSSATQPCFKRRE